MSKSILLSAAACMSLAPALAAQSQFGLIPFDYTGDLYVTDSTNDSVMRLADINLDGNYNGAGETSVYYDEAFGGQTLGNNNGVTVASNGDLYMCDTSEDKIFRLTDFNGDGDCHDLGEIITWFDGDPFVNASGIEMVSPNRVKVDVLGQVWVAEANNSAGTDSILLLRDLNLDGDANDAGEATIYYAPLTSGSTGDSVPNDVFIGADQHVYYIEGGSTGFIPKAVFRMDDLDGNGSIDPSTEVAVFFDPPAMAATPFFWCLTQDANGYFYTADTGNDLIWRFRDENADNVIDPMTEAVVWWQSTGASLIWDLAADSNGGMYVCESQAPDRVLYMFDTNSDGTIDPVTEVTEVYSDLLSSVDIGNPRSMALDARPTLFAPSAVTLGSTANLVNRTTQGDLVLVFWSTMSSSPTPLFPYGYLELFPAPGSGLLYTGFADGFGIHTKLLTVPSNPGLSGATIYTQSLAGKPDRFTFSNLGTTTAL
jgi:hypothetical protein